MSISETAMPLLPDLWWPDSRLGQAADLAVLAEGQWLKDSAVGYLVVPRRGRWHVTMVFGWARDPLRLLCRQIDSYPTEARARAYADLLQRNIQKDARGTLKIDQDAFSFCPY
jgi:hypothetical protein